MSYKFLEFQNVSYIYNSGGPNRVEALKDVSLVIDKGEFISVVGASGSGKSTLARHCNGILVPTAGKVMVNGKDTRQRKVRAQLWREVGLVLQSPEQQLFEATVFDDVAFGPKNLELSREETERAVNRALEWVGLDAGEIGGLSPFALSGGEKRRVAIAGILALSPSLLVLDEPLAGLDPAGRRMLLGQLKSLNREKGITILMITHSMDDAAAVSDRLIVMDRGRVKAQGAAGEIFLSTRDLENLGLEVPFATRVLRRLRQLGYPVGEGYTLERAAAEILKIYRSRGGKNA